MLKWNSSREDIYLNELPWSPGGQQTKVILPENKVRAAKATNEERPPPAVESWPHGPEKLCRTVTSEHCFPFPQREVVPQPHTNLALFLCIGCIGNGLIYHLAIDHQTGGARLRLTQRIACQRALIRT